MFPTWSPNDPGLRLTLQCSGLLDPTSAHPTPLLLSKQVEDELGESELETHSVVAVKTEGLLASPRARAQVWPPYLREGGGGLSSGSLSYSQGLMGTLWPALHRSPKRGRVSSFQTQLEPCQAVRE